MHVYILIEKNSQSSLIKPLHLHYYTISSHFLSPKNHESQFQSFSCSFCIDALTPPHLFPILSSPRKDKPKGMQLTKEITTVCCFFSLYQPQELASCKNETAQESCGS